jgi:RNA polymerase sigma factor (sigma-70 family)
VIRQYVVMDRQSLGSESASDGAAIADSIEHPMRFAMIFDRHYDAVHRYLARRIQRTQADDLASMTFVVAFERRRRFRLDSASARPWLLGIATNLLRERLRSERREQGLIERLGREHRLDGRGVEPEQVAGPGPDRLATALATLDPKQRDVLLLHAWEELSYAEIAQALEVPIGTVRSRLARARAHLGAQLQAPRAASLADSCEEQR